MLQLRLLPQLRALKQQLDAAPRTGRADVELTYITSRGRWYNVSWKGVPEKSGGLALNIGVHFFDLLIWLFGKPKTSQVFVSRPDKMSGVFELEHARVRWFLSVDQNDLPAEVRAQGKTAFRSLVTDGRELEFSDGFPDLHTAVYRDVLEGGGCSISDVRPSIQLAYDILTASVEAPTDIAHPMLRTSR